MFVSTYRVSATERAGARRQWIAVRPFTIGSASDCDVVVDDDAVAPYHLRVTLADGAIVVENLIDGTQTRVAQCQPIPIGRMAVELRFQAPPVIMTSGSSTFEEIGNPPPPRPKPPPRTSALSTDPTEQQFLDVLRARPDDAATRLVYADWLESRGFNAKAELVRYRAYLRRAVHQRVPTIMWRAVAACTPIDQCVRDNCPGSWDALAPNTRNDFVRHCATCERDIRYCVDSDDVGESLGDGRPVVCDATLDRDDLHAWYGRNWLGHDD